MDFKNKKLDAFFYKTKNENEPVKEWLKKLSKEDKKTIGGNITTLQYGWPIGMPLVDSLGQGLWEIRSKLSGNKIARVIFFMDDNTIILVHGFIKKNAKNSKICIRFSKGKKRGLL